VRWTKKLTRICRRLMFCRMSRRTTAVPADPYPIFQGAEASLYACRILDAHCKRHRDPHILPSVMAVNSALALELFLKCLRTIESGGFFKRHELDQLFRDLRKSTRDKIRRRHDEIQASAERGPFFAKLRADGFRTDLDSLLKMGRKTFEHFRYPFDPQIVAQKTTWALDDLMRIVRNMILEKHPEWTPTGYPPP
jgi:hypothetical protein